MKRIPTTALCGLALIIVGCTARNSQTEFYRGGNPTNIQPQPDVLPPPTYDPGPATGNSVPLLQPPGADNGGGPELLSPEPLSGPEAQRRGQPRVRNVRTDPWGRPVNRQPRVRTASRKTVQQSLWKNQFQSSRGRAIQTAQFGIGPLRVLVMSSLRGTDPASITVVDYLAQTMRDRAELQNDCTVLFLRNPNPDGLADRSPYNGRGIDLNQNFPAKNWSPHARGLSGPKASSENETQVIVRLINDFKPDRLVVVQVSRTGNNVAYNGNIRQLARKVAGDMGIGRVDRAKNSPGSLVSYAADRNLPVIFLAADRQLDGRAAWNANAAGLISAMTYERPRYRQPPEEDESPTASEPVADQQRFPLPLNSIGGPSTKERGSRRLSAPIPVPRGFYELPPPRRP